MSGVTATRGNGWTRYSWPETDPLKYQAWVRDGETEPYAYAVDCAPATRAEMPAALLAALLAALGNGETYNARRRADIAAIHAGTYTAR